MKNISKKKLIIYIVLLVVVLAVICVAAFGIWHMVKAKRIENALKYVKDSYGVECEFSVESGLMKKFDFDKQELYFGTMMALEPVDAEVDDYRSIRAFVTLDGKVLSDDYYIMSAENRLSEILMKGTKSAWTEGVKITSEFDTGFDFLMPGLHERSLGVEVDMDTKDWLKENITGDIMPVREKLPAAEINVKVEVKAPIDYVNESSKLLRYMSYINENKFVVDSINVSYYEAENCVGKISFSELDYEQENEEDNVSLTS